MTYPQVMDEWRTLALLEDGMSIARYGDGELNICLGGPAKLQKRDARLANRLIDILDYQSTECLIGIPRIGNLNTLPEKKAAFWKRYREPRYTELFGPGEYASSFITRPDSVPEINTLDYWARITRLWDGKRVLMVEGEDSNFSKNDLLRGAGVLDVLKCPKKDAFDVYRPILNTIKSFRGEIVLLSLGPTATVLAWELSEMGYQALDVGHLSFLYDKCFIQGLPH